MNSSQPVVLIIDDEPQIRRFLRAGFELENFSVIEAENGLTDPGEVRRYVKEHAARLSGLSRREATKHLG